jgi:hypothetical protein
MTEPKSLGIRERFFAFAARISDNVLGGRLRSRIVIGSDRKDTINSGYGDGGENDPESASIDLVAGFVGDSGNPNFSVDKSRLYLVGKTDPDDYLGIDKGAKVEGEAAFIGISDNIYLKARKKVKIIGPKYSIVIDEEGNLLIEATTKIEAKVGSSKLVIQSSGIELDAGQGPAGKIITDNDSCVGIDPVSGSPIISNFKQAGAIVLNSKVTVK